MSEGSRTTTSMLVIRGEELERKPHFPQADTLCAMARSKRHPRRSLIDAPGVREAAQALIEAVRATSGERELSPKAYDRALREVARLRGRPLAVQALTAPSGSGARVRLADGRTVLDFVCGIAPISSGTATRICSRRPWQPRRATASTRVTRAGGRISRVVARAPAPCGPTDQTRLALDLGAIANENALKIVLQKHAPADTIVAFERNFAGRTLALAEITDKAAYREGLPSAGAYATSRFPAPTDRSARSKLSTRISRATRVGSRG